MVSFNPTEDQQLLVDTIRRWSLNDAQAAAHEHDEAEKPALEVVQKGWQIGLLPSGIPEELGGFGELSAVTNVLALEEMAYGDLSTALHVMTPALFAFPVVLFGTADQRESLLPMFLEERVTPATAALIEPGMFFDHSDLKTTATVEGDQVRLTGVKSAVPLAADAAYILVYARNVDTGATEAYVVQKDADGVQVQEREKLMGIRALPTYRVAFNDVRLPQSSRLGGAVGIDYALLLNRSRIALAALAVGVGRAAYDYAREYAKERVAFGRPIAQNQSIAFMLAETAIELDAARLMAWEAAWKLDRGEDAAREAYLAKQHGDKTALFATDNGVQILGGYGFIREYPVERLLRNARGFPAFLGLALA